ncbi:hypothetical protein WG936_08130 [Corynebacterium sp. H127]|uniref:hypothetical protein n=1 Tax=Corynebacterium sp. H127 TaxID=3133418 RepID=UPI0030B52463
MAKNASTILLSAPDLLDALRVAVLFTEKNTYPGIRLDLDEAAGEIEVTAVVKNHVMVMPVDADWISLIDPDRDAGFELTIKQIRDVLQVFKNFNKRPKGEDEEPPQVGISLTEEEISFIDESGIGLNIPLYSCERKDLEMSRSLASTIDETVQTQARVQRVELAPEQLERMTRVGKILGQAPAFEGVDVSERVEQTGVPMHRTLITCQDMLSIATYYPSGAPQEEPSESEQTDLSFEDDEASQSDIEPSPGLRVVQSRPLMGV